MHICFLSIVCVKNLHECKKNLYFTCVLVFYVGSFSFTLFSLCLNILCWKFFFWTIFKEKIVAIPIFVPLYILCLFSLLAYRICVLLLDLRTLSMMDQVYIFWFVCFRFLMFGICCISWICSLLYSRNVRVFRHYFFNQLLLWPPPLSGSPRASAWIHSKFSQRSLMLCSFLILFALFLLFCIVYFAMSLSLQIFSSAVSTLKSILFTEFLLYI